MSIAEAAREAGEAILEVVRRGFEVETKRDSSPVTEADRAAELIILAALAHAAPGVPVIAEEEVAAGRIPAHDDTYFLVDPLDGTKEFVRGGDDYTVNIGLIEQRQRPSSALFSRRPPGGCMAAASAMVPGVDDGGGRQAIRTRHADEQLTAVASKSHLNQATIDYLRGSGRHLRLCRGWFFAQILHRCGRASRYLSARIADERVGHGRRTRGAVGGRRARRWSGRDVAALRQASLPQSRICRDLRAGSRPGSTQFLEPFSGGGDLSSGL